MSTTCTVDTTSSFEQHDHDGSGTVTEAELCNSPSAMFYLMCTNSGFYSSSFVNGTSFRESMCIYDLDNDDQLGLGEFLCAFVFEHGGADQLHSTCCSIGEIPERRACCAQNPANANCTTIGLNVTLGSQAFDSPPPTLPPPATPPPPTTLSALDEFLPFIIFGGVVFLAVALLYCVWRCFCRSNANDDAATIAAAQGSTLFMDTWNQSFRKRWKDNLQSDGTWLAPVFESTAESFVQARQRWTGTDRAYSSNVHTARAVRMQVHVPVGMAGGMTLQINTPSGWMQVLIPNGLRAGSTFDVEVPAPAQTPQRPSIMARQQSFAESYRAAKQRWSGAGLELTPEPVRV